VGKQWTEILPLKFCEYVWYMSISMYTYTHICIYRTWKNLDVHIFNIFLLRLNLTLEIDI